MCDKVSKALNEMAPEELITYFGSNAVPWACHGVGMLRSAYAMWRVFWGRFKQGFQHAKPHHKLTAADMLDACTDCSVHAYRLLAALAMENIAKGLVIAKGKLVIKNHQLPPWFLNHDIVSLLCQKASFQLNEQERRALTDSTKAIIWQTRYPMPNNTRRLRTQWPSMEFYQPFNHPVDFRDLATRVLHDYPDKVFHGAFVSGSGLIQVLELECPHAEALNS